MVISEEVHSDTYWSVTGTCNILRACNILKACNTLIWYPHQWAPHLPKAVWGACMLGRDRVSGGRRQSISAHGLWPKSHKDWTGLNAKLRTFLTLSCPACWEQAKLGPSMSEQRREAQIPNVQEHCSSHMQQPAVRWNIRYLRVW